MNLKPYYEQYTASVSTREMAISLKTAETIIRFLEERKPNKIADVGSGFSSFIAAKYAFETGANVDIFDESPEWLYKTEKFIKSQGYNTSKIQKKQ
jgi:alanine dehydrogenase